VTAGTAKQKRSLLKLQILQIYFVSSFFKLINLLIP
jgi:hypothetical protein